MAVRIHLDKAHAQFTSLEFITGKVIFTLTNNETISGIVVKLEGESKTLIEQANQEVGPRGRNHAEIEFHKVSK